MVLTHICTIWILIPIYSAGAKVRVFNGMYHGFVVRGDFANNAAVRNAANEAVADMITFIVDHAK